MRSIFLAIIITSSLCWFLIWQLDKSMKAFINVPSSTFIISD
jgi:hypothetical protein